MKNTAYPHTPNKAATAKPSHCRDDKTDKAANLLRANNQPDSKTEASRNLTAPPVNGGRDCPNILPIGQDAPHNTAIPKSFT